MANIERHSRAWEMMSDLYKLYDEYVAVDIYDYAQTHALAKKQFEFEKKYYDVLCARELSEAISTSVFRRLEGYATL